MHEMGIANSVLDTAIRKESLMSKRPHPQSEHSIGELAGVDPDAMSFCFEALVRGTELEPLALEIEYCPRRYQCGACGHSYAAPRDDFACPECGKLDSQFLGGDELELAYMEVEDGARAAGA